MRLRLRTRNRLSYRLKRRLRVVAVASTMASLAAGIFYLYSFIGQVSESRAAEKEALLNPKVEVLEGYSGRKKISIHVENIPAGENLSNFPMLVSLRLDELKRVQDGGMVSGRDGEDIVFTSEDGITILPYQIERYEPVSGKLLAWVRLDTLNTIRNSVYLYYGKSDALSFEDNKTFDSPYEAVWHMNRGFQSDGMVPMAGEYRGVKDEEGRFAAAKDFLAYDGAHVKFESKSVLQLNNDFTVSAWIKTSPKPYDQTIISNASRNGGFSLYIDPNGKAVFEITDAQGRVATILKSEGGSVIEKDKWNQLTAVFSGRTDSLILYLNGVRDRAIHTELDYAGGTNLVIGAMPSGNKGFFNGLIDELRIASEDFSSTKIKTLYHSESNPESFFSIDGQEVFSASPRLSEIINLESEVLDGHVSVRWQSAEERNLDYYTLERATPGGKFNEVARVLGKGNSDEAESYFIIDPAPLFGTAEYRVRSTSFKGESQVSESRTVHVQAPLANLGIKRIEPNPFKDRFEVAFDAALEEDIAVKLTSISGNVVFTQSMKPNTIDENIFEFHSPENLRPGIYFLSIQQAAEQKTVKLIKQL